ncbi:MAG: ATP synthase subunit I [Gammaproteobacteria bacterium]
MAERHGTTVSKVLTLQVLIITAMSAGFAVASGQQSALSSLLGGAAAFVPNLYFAMRVHRAKHQSARKIVNSFYAGESGKLILTAILFYLIFQVPHIKILPLLSGYIAALSVFWFALVMR